MSNGAIQSGLVSTIIPVHNRAKMLRLAVDSVLAQTYRPVEILIADDGSSDDTSTVALALVEEHPQVIRYFRQENQGPGPARELGRKHAQGEFIQYLDSDDRLMPNKFADQVKVLGDYPDCDIAYGITRLVDQSGKIFAEPFKWTGREIPHLFPGLLVDRWWSTHTPLYRRSLTDRIGPWCNMRWSQDWEYDTRAGALNVAVKSCATLVSEHVHHDGVRQTGAADWQRDAVRLCNRVELLEKLWAGASEVSVDRSEPEVAHFCRWSFAVARQCASSGLKEEVDRLLAIINDAGQGVPEATKGVAMFCMLRKVLGGVFAAKMLGAAERFRSRAGSKTLQQSWMEQGKREQS